jgi:type 1 fimbria pilin
VFAKEVVMVGRFLLLLAFALPAHCFASDGVIRFAGRVVEPTCIVQTSTTDKTDTATLNTCSSQVAKSTSVNTQIVTPNAYMVPWRANDTSKPDAPVTQWKVIQVTYS